jgi:hypothetical protein
VIFREGGKSEENKDHCFGAENSLKLAKKLAYWEAIVLRKYLTVMRGSSVKFALI